MREENNQQIDSQKSDADILIEDASFDITGHGSVKIEKQQRQIRPLADIIFKSIEIVVALATVAATIVAWRTLIEMKTERDNAYRPDIVVAPKSFYGGYVGTDEIEPDKKYLFIRCDCYYPSLWCESDPSDNHHLMYLETPFLTIKNIGQGTAKDIKVTFDTDWMDDAIDVLNNNESDWHKYKKVSSDSGEDYFDIEYYDEGEIHSNHILSVEENSVEITYITAGEDKVVVPLPESWNEMLACLFGQRLNYSYFSGAYFGPVSVSLDIPDLKVTVEYLDMQGKEKEQKLIIPWSANYSYPENATLSNEILRQMQLRTGFYEDYIR